MPQVKANGDNVDVAAAVRGNTAFAIDLCKALKDLEGNLFFSPYSISTALAVTYAGARGNTASQIAQTLHFSLDQRQLHPTFAAIEAELKAVQQAGHIQLRVANSLWPQQGYPFLEAFLALAQEHYGVIITPVNYSRDPEAARVTINNWVEEKTEQKIKDLIQSGTLDPLTRLVLVNAIYFKGNWANQFDVTRTRTAPFWVNRTERVDVPMMTQQHRFGYGETASLQVLELPYVGNDLSMIVLLPKEIDSFEKFEAELTSENLDSWTKPVRKGKVTVFLPRFKMTSQFELSTTLISMGMVDAFDPNLADFSGMDGTKSLSIQAAVHKAFIDVNEEGTEAAAATGVGFEFRSAPPVFRADHPFFFFIRENHTGSILFLGRVVNPSN